jgi:NAD(P)-dependent dehydrogenase (short-subunit alcohol dehydrogenase family)
MKKKLQDGAMTYFVTGGSRGLGEAIVLRAAQEGHNVAFTYNQNESAAASVVEKARELAPERRCRAYRLDVRDSSAVEKIGDKVVEDFEDVHVVVANAGVNLPNLAMTMSDEEWNTVIDTNLTGAFFVCRHFLPVFLSNRFGRFILISSLGQAGASGQANYAASKAGLLGLSATLAKEYGRKGITSNAILPGYFDTDMTRRDVPEEGTEFWKKFCPLGRIGQPDEVAKVVTFLASESASYINGQAIPVNGGLDWAP